ncbi:MAG: anthranilate phosphoribosyltransferase [Chthoniobacterales bacterium]|nr:anthranilate phosphoribosyltransferase [Chthoniobacterales bacterium]
MGGSCACCEARRGAALKDWIQRIVTGSALRDDETAGVVADLVSSRHSDEAKADFLEALHRRGETPDEILGFARGFLREAKPFEAPADIGPLLEVCGTGGDRLGLFNVSTAVMFVAAGAGAKVVKHGNRGATSKSGGADVLEALGLPLDFETKQLQKMLEEAGATFLFAPSFHPAFRAVAPARKILSARGSASVFNILGPLLNPAQPELQLSGVFAAQLTDIYANVLRGLGRTKAWVVHGRAGDHGVMDEVSTLGPTMVVEISSEDSRRFTLDPAEMGVRQGKLADLQGGDAAENARIMTLLLSGEMRGAARDLVLVNTAAALLVAGIATSWGEGMSRAAESIDSGAAAKVLQKMLRFARSR